MSETQSAPKLAKQIEKLILEDKKKEAQAVLNKVLKNDPEMAKMALRAINDAKAKSITDRWLNDIVGRYPDKPQAQQASTGTSTVLPKRQDDGDNLDWLTKGDAAPRRAVSTPSKRDADPTESSRPVPRNKTPERETQQAPRVNASSALSLIQNVIQSRQLPAFVIRYWPALLWWTVGVIGLVTLVRSFTGSQAASQAAYVTYMATFVPISIFRHLRLNALMFFRTQFFSSRNYVGYSGNTLYYRDQPDVVHNFFFNIVLTILSLVFLYPLRETIAQTVFLIQAIRSWRQGTNLELRAAMWGRGWR
jgi:hypothetical protein